MSFRDQEFGQGALATAGRGDDRSVSVIDQYSTFDGSFVAERDLRVDGVVKGTIVCQGTLFVAEGATVNAHVEAENITVAGDLTGDIDCRGRLRLLPSGVLKGQVKTRALVVAQGAVYDGDLTMIKATLPAQTPVENEPMTESTPGPRPATRAPRTENRAPAETTDQQTGTASAAPSTFIRRLGGPETPWEGRPSGDQPPPATVEE